MGDEKDAWYFEIGSCHHLIAVRVPDDSYLVVPNCIRVHEVDIDDTENAKHSKDLFEFVTAHNLLNNANRHSFNFAKAFVRSSSIMNGELEPYYNVDRIWFAQSILSPSIKQPVRMEEYPLFLKPNQKISVDDIFKVLRATYENTELKGIATRPIGVVRTTESHVMTVASSMPCNLKGVI